MISPSQSKQNLPPEEIRATPAPASGEAPAKPGPGPRHSRETHLRKHADYQRVYQAARKQFSASMSWFMAAQPSVQGALPARPSGARVGLTAGKVLGKAHERNRIKRRMREAVRRHLTELPDGIDLILHPKRSVMVMDFGKLESEILRIFRQAAGQFRAQAGSPDRIKTHVRETFPSASGPTASAS